MAVLTFGQTFCPLTAHNAPSPAYVRALEPTPFTTCTLPSYAHFLRTPIIQCAPLLHTTTTARPRYTGLNIIFPHLTTRLVLILKVLKHTHAVTCGSQRFSGRVTSAHWAWGQAVYYLTHISRWVRWLHSSHTLIKRAFSQRARVYQHTCHAYVLAFWLVTGHEEYTPLFNLELLRVSNTHAHRPRTTRVLLRRPPSYALL